MEKLMNELPDEPFTGLSTKGGFRAATSACYEAIRSEGGNIQALNDIVYDATTTNRKAIRFNLDNYEIEDRFEYDPIYPGEYVFWRCVEECLSTKSYDLAKLKLVIVKGPGKTRIATKGKIALKVIQDFVNGIVSWCLSKSFESSTSGMEKENHGWQFFKELFKHEEVFQISSRNRLNIGLNEFTDEIQYLPVYAGSTDFKKATDYQNHSIARIIGKRFLKKVGIPTVLSDLIIESGLNPRIIEFRGEGILSTIGLPTNEENVRQILLRKGVMQGDPLTKVILHLTNICIRETSKRICVLEKMEGGLNLLSERIKRFSETKVIENYF